MTKTEPTEGVIYFRSSSQGNLMTEAQTKSPKQNYEDALENLNKYSLEYANMNNKETKTAKNKLEQITKTKEKISDLEPFKDKYNFSSTAKKEMAKTYFAAKYGRYESIDNKYVRKGTKSEEQGITLYSLVKGVMFVKNETRLYNDEYFITGEPDIFIPSDINQPSIIDAKAIVDIKCSWNLHTWRDSAFADGAKKIYEYQGFDYMILSPKAETHTVAHVLVSTPLDQVQDEIRKEQFKFERSDNASIPTWLAISIVKELVYEKNIFDAYLRELNLNPDEDDKSMAMYLSFIEIPIEERVHEFTFKRDESIFAKIKEVNTRCNTYIKEELMTGNWRRN